MKGYLKHTLAAVGVILLLLNHIHQSSATRTSRDMKADFIKTSCNVTRSPRLCYNSLKSYAVEIQTDQKALAHTALTVALEFAKQTHITVKTFSTFQGLNPTVIPAISDCEKQLKSAVEQLQNSKAEMSKIVDVSKSRFQVSNVQTWVSAALTNENTCKDGFGEITMKGKVETVSYRHITIVARLTSNALALFHNYASSATISLN